MTVKKVSASLIISCLKDSESRDIQPTSQHEQAQEEIEYKCFSFRPGQTEDRYNNHKK